MNLDDFRVLAKTASAVFSGPLEQRLNQADAQLGDGDTGVTLRRVFERIAETALLPHADIGALFSACGRASASATGSSLGTLCAVGLLQAGKQCAGRDQLGAADLGPLLSNVRATMQARGKAQLGDKTVLDMLEAIAKTLTAQADPNRQALAAASAALETLNEFRGKPCRIGRARVFGDRSIGLDDPGMLALAELTFAIAKPSEKLSAAGSLSGLASHESAQG